MIDFIVLAAQNDLILDSSTVPDISVGKTWSIFWTETGLAAKYGERKKHEHCFPSYYPQARSNPQDIWVYPVEACGAFRRWLNEIYIPEKFPKYLGGQVKKKTMSVATMLGLLAAVSPARIEAGGANDDDADADDADELPRAAAGRRR